MIQVCADLEAPETRQRESRALLAADDERPDVSSHMVTLTTDTARGLPQNVTVHSAATWLLSADEGSGDVS